MLVELLIERKLRSECIVKGFHIAQIGHGVRRNEIARYFDSCGPSQSRLECPQRNE